MLLVREEDVSSACGGSCLLRWKIAFGAILLVEGLVLGHVVCLVRRFASSERFVKYAIHIGNALSGGVFLATGLLHILPEAVELLAGEGHGEEDHGEDHGDEEESLVFPTAYAVVLGAFYLLFFVEQVLLPRLGAGHLHVVPSEKDALEKHVVHSDAGGVLGAIEKIVDDDTTSPTSEGGSSPKIKAYGSVSDIEGEQFVAPLATFKSKQFVKCMIIVAGISVHSLIESLSLGIAGHFPTVLNLFIATASHRWATAAALGFKFSGYRLAYFPFFTLLVAFSLMVPIGIGIGLAASSLSTAVQGVFFALSAGTFLYVGIFETLSAEFVEHKKWPLSKFLATVVGAVIIVLVTVVLTKYGIHG